MGQTEPGIEQTAVKMMCHELSHLPEVHLPEGYSMRHSVSADNSQDIEQWCALLTAAFPEEKPATADTWHSQIVEKEGYHPAHVFFMCAPDGRACATASAMQSQSQGYIHWVATDPAHRGKKLGKLVSLQCLHSFSQRGFSSAILDTHAFRLPAIRIYLDLGFQALISTEQDREAWAYIGQQLGRSLPRYVNRISNT